MNIISHSRIAQAAYLDLLRLHPDETASELIGSIEERHRAGRVYLYDKFRIGTELKSRYLGEDTPALRARLAQASALKEGVAARRTQVARLARVLRVEGFIGMDRDTGSILLAFAKVGVFRLGGTLIRTGSLRSISG